MSSSIWNVQWEPKQFVNILWWIKMEDRAGLLEDSVLVRAPWWSMPSNTSRKRTSPKRKTLRRVVFSVNWRLLILWQTLLTWKTLQTKTLRLGSKRSWRSSRCSRRSQTRKTSFSMMEKARASRKLSRWAKAKTEWTNLSSRLRMVINRSFLLKNSPPSLRGLTRRCPSSGLVRTKSRASESPFSAQNFWMMWQHPFSIPRSSFCWQIFWTTLEKWYVAACVSLQKSTQRVVSSSPTRTKTRSISLRSQTKCKKFPETGLSSVHASEKCYRGFT